MKCPNCNTENKSEATTCKKCGQLLVVQPLWKPTWSWHLKVLTIIYVVLIGMFFLLNVLLKPYMRTLPKDITPWLVKADKK